MTDKTVGKVVSKPVTLLLDSTICRTLPATSLTVALPSTSCSSVTLLTQPSATFSEEARSRLQNTGGPPEFSSVVQSWRAREMRVRGTFCSDCQAPHVDGMHVG